MAQLTRRNLLKKTSTGALVAGALAVVPGGAAFAAGRTETPDLAADVAEMGSTPFVAYVRNPTAGELVLLVGSEEITVHDPALVARLWQARSHTSHRPAKSVVR